MTQADKKKRVLEYIERGKEIGTTEHVKTEPIGISQIKGPRYETWMSEINVFNERHLKDHPLYSDIHSAFFHHNTNRKCYQNMMGYLQALANDSEYWQEPQQEAIERPAKPSKEEGKKSAMNPIIFISHRTTDAKVADMLKDYLVATGIPNDYIFCSSLPGNDVNSVISREVKEKITNSSVNIAILSKNYYESAYCLNEAGIIWLQDPNTPAIVIGLPEINHTNMFGFLNSDFKLRRLDNANDISAIYDTVSSAVRATPVSFSVATAAGHKLSDRYAEYLKSRVEPTVPEVQLATSTAPMENITTDDERVVLYYIMTKRIRRVKKSDICAWMAENEIYNINVENALDLLSSLGAGTYEQEILNLDVGVFRECTAHAEELVPVLTPIVEKYQMLSSKRFIELWNAGNFTEEDKLFVAYIVQNRTTTFGARWMEKGQIESIHQWELNNCLDGSVASTYSARLNKFIENQFVYESDWTSHGNAREYTLCPSLKNLLLGADFPYSIELETLMEAHKDTLPF